MITIEAGVLKHTRGHINCPICEAMEMRDNGILISPKMTFDEAFDEFLDTMAIDLGGVVSDVRIVSPRRIADLKQYARAASKFFGELRLNQIQVGHLKEYTRARAVCDRTVCRKDQAPWAERAGANLIRKELNVVMRVMREAGAWTEKHVRRYRPIKHVESNIGRAMSAMEQGHFLKVASSRVEWQLVYWYSIVALATTASTNELRGLQLGDILLEQGVIQVRPGIAKASARIRTIPLRSAEVAYALSRLMERARGLGATMPYHYLFPARQGGTKYDPCKPQSAWGLSKTWDAVRSAAGMEWLRPYDLRHTAITRYAERGTPIAVIMALAGHMTRRMQDHYTSISDAAKSDWAASTVGAEIAFNASAMPKWATAPEPIAKATRGALAPPAAIVCKNAKAPEKKKPAALPAPAPVMSAPPARHDDNHGGRRTVFVPAGGRRRVLRRAVSAWRTHAAG